MDQGAEWDYVRRGGIAIAAKEASWEAVCGFWFGMGDE
jgi:hypothetical protein